MSSIWDGSLKLNTPITKQNALAGFKGTSSYVPTGDSVKPGMDPTMKMDLALAGVDLLGSIFMGAQAVKAKPPVVPRVPVPTMETPKIESGVAGEQALIKENMGIQTNSILNNAMETGQDMNTVGPGIFANSNRAMRESTAQMSKEQINTINQQNVTNVDVANKNKMAAYAGESEYQTRKSEVLGKDALMRGQQLSMAFSNIGKIGSRLLNDFMLTDLIKKGNAGNNNILGRTAMANSLYGQGNYQDQPEEGK
jgi:hypothetical protein